MTSVAALPADASLLLQKLPSLLTFPDVAQTMLPATMAHTTACTLGACLMSGFPTARAHIGQRP